MRRTWWVGCGAVVALVLAVLVVRPSSQARPADVAPPSQAAVGDPLRPAALAGLRLADVPVTAQGVGPLLLGQDAADLLAAGWQSYVTGACSRLLGSDLQDATLTGWVVDGQVASVQVEAAAAEVPQVVSEVGFVFGTPVAEVAAPGTVERRGLGDGSVSVSTARVPTDAGSVLVSDAGGPVVRLVEVATAEGEACGLDASLRESSRFPGAEAALTSFSDAIGTDDLGHRHLSSWGASVAQLAASSLWAPLVRDLSGTGCEAVARTDGGDRITLFLLDGVVVAEDFALDVSPLRRPPYYTPGEAYQETAGGELATTERLVVEERAPSGGGPSVRTTLLAGLQDLPELDTVALAVGPLVELQQVGRPCQVLAR